MKSRAIVTLADSNYFDLLLELISSIRQFEQSKNIAICVLDAGLKDDQIQNLNNKVEIIKKANWDIEVPKIKVLGKEWLKSQVSRAFLPDYFPDFKKYLWIDCDAWVNTWECVDIYFKACENGKIGITQTIGAGYKVLTRVKWILGSLAAIKSQNYKHAKKSGFSENIARKIAFAPHLNIGVFSLEKDSAIYHNPAKFQINRILHDPERDMAIIFDYEIEKGMSKDEVLDVYESFEKVIESNFPSRSIWNYLSREHFLLYLDHYGREEILNMTRPLVQHT